MNMNNNITEIDEFNRINGTNLPDKPLYKMKVVQFGTLMTDLIVTPTNFTKSILLSGQKSRPASAKTTSKYDLSPEEKKEQSLQRSYRRSRQAIQYKAREFGANRLLSLTSRDVLTSDEYRKVFLRFTRLVREKELVDGKLVTAKKKKEWDYVSVDEKQERGAWHSHIAVKDNQDLAFLRACWYVALGGNVDDKGSDVRGSVNVQSRQRRFSGRTKTFRCMQIVNYLTKYITKSFESDDSIGKARYRAARHIKKPIIWRRYLSQTIYDGKDAFINAMKETLDIAREQGLTDYEIFNVGTDVFVLRGMFDKNSLFR